MRRSSILFVFAGMIALGAGLFLALLPNLPRPELNALWLESPRPLPEISLIDQQGAPLEKDYFKQGWSLLFIGFTSCPDVCPTTLADLARAYPKIEQQLGDTELKVVFLSVDPQRDKPERLDQYIRFFRPGFEAITGDHADLIKITRSLGLAYAMVDAPGGDYMVDHSADMALINPNGELEALFRPTGEVGEIRRVSMAQLEKELPQILNYFSSKNGFLTL